MAAKRKGAKTAECSSSCCSACPAYFGASCQATLYKQGHCNVIEQAFKNDNVVCVTFPEYGPYANEPEHMFQSGWPYWCSSFMRNGSELKKLSCQNGRLDHLRGGHAVYCCCSKVFWQNQAILSNIDSPHRVKFSDCRRFSVSYGQWS